MPHADPDAKRAYARRHYEENCDAYKQRARAHAVLMRARVRELVREAKSRPCADCGVSYPFYVMQFDHLFDKEFNIGDAIRRSYGVKRVLAEIAKCEVVCSNCHAERTYRRREAQRSGVEQFGSSSAS